jgi:hypothetical protein
MWWLDRVQELNGLGEMRLQGQREVQESVRKGSSRGSAPIGLLPRLVLDGVANYKNNISVQPDHPSRARLRKCCYSYRTTVQFPVFKEAAMMYVQEVVSHLEKVLRLPLDACPPPVPPWS